MTKVTDRSKGARDARYEEYMGLKSIPFLSANQAARFRELLIERVIDNKHAFLESLNRKEHHGAA